MNDMTHSREQILQPEPVFCDEYLSEVLHLREDGKIISKIMIEDRVTDTTRIIRLLITWKAGKEEHKKMLFLKLPIMDKQDNAFDKWSMHEIDFYRHIDGNDELPIIKCHDAYIFDDKKNFLLMLDDVSTDYCTANDIDRNEFENWLLASESLAKFHSFYWNGANASALKLLQGDNDTMDEKIKTLEAALEKFLPYASDYYNNEILEAYPSALKDAIMFERKNIGRREQNKNISVIHGDSHIFNFMFPKVSSQKPLIVDFQFWRMGIPAVDIMNLTRVAFPFMDDPEHYFKLLEHYYMTLQEYGVSNYSLDEFLYDYYLSTAMAVFGPVFNYYSFGLGHEYWGQGVYDTINNYKMAGMMLAKYREG